MTKSIKIVLLVSILLSITFSKMFGAANVTRDAATGDMTYKQTFKLNNNLSDEDAYEFVQQWFTRNPDKFTRHHGTAPFNESHAENKIAMEEAFSNNIPLQSLDPASKRVTGRTMVNYYGGSNSSIELMYIEYYVILEIDGHELTATISHIRYHHFSVRNYTARTIYYWQGNNRVSDSAGKFEVLSAAQAGNKDITDINNFLTGDMNKLLDDLRQMLQGNNVLASGL